MRKAWRRLTTLDREDFRLEVRQCPHTVPGGQLGGPDSLSRSMGARLSTISPLHPHTAAGGGGYHSQSQRSPEPVACCQTSCDKVSACGATWWASPFPAEADPSPRRCSPTPITCLVQCLPVLAHPTPTQQQLAPGAPGSGCGLHLIDLTFF